jgi:hypothetical protein
MSGLSRTPGKRVRVNSPPRVRIPLSPPIPCFTGYFFVLNLLKYGISHLKSTPPRITLYHGFTIAYVGIDVGIDVGRGVVCRRSPENYSLSM